MGARPPGLVSSHGVCARPGCDRIFVRRANNQRFCKNPMCFRLRTSAYYQQWRREHGIVGQLQPCGHCGTEFLSELGVKYCRPDCRRAARSKHNATYHQRRKQRMRFNFLGGPVAEKKTEDRPARRFIYIVHVGSGKSGWEVREDGKPAVYRERKRDAERHAYERGRESWKVHGVPAEVIVQNLRGQICERRTYGRDPKHRKG